MAAATKEQKELLGKDMYFDGDFSVSAAGDFQTIEGLEALKQALHHRLITRPGEYRLRPEYGVGVRDFVKKRRQQSSLNELRQRITDQISLDDRVEQVVEVVIEDITDGVRIGVVVRASGETLKFSQFDFRETDTIGTIGTITGAGFIT